MNEKVRKNRMNKDGLRLYAVIAFFLISGFFYSNSYRKGEFSMGVEASVEELGMLQETTLSGEELIGKVNINLADEKELMRLAGIGEKTAEEIIAYRNANGDFGKIEDIMEVRGIGEKTFEKIKDEITVE